MLLLLLGIVAGAVIVSSVTQRHVQLDDGTVWVTSLKDRKAARFNVRNRDADAGVASTAARFDVAQHDGSTVISEGTKAQQHRGLHRQRKRQHHHQIGYADRRRRQHRGVHQRQDGQCVGRVRR